MQGFSTPAAAIVETVVPNPKLKLLDQIREVMRLKHYSLRTERTYGDWVRRYVQFHRMRARAEMLPAEPKIEAFLSDLAVNGRVAVSTQNQALNGHRETTNIERPTSNAEPRTKEILKGSVNEIVIFSRCRAEMVLRWPPPKGKCRDKHYNLIN